MLAANLRKDFADFLFGEDFPEEELVVFDADCDVAPHCRFFNAAFLADLLYGKAFLEKVGSFLCAVLKFALLSSSYEVLMLFEMGML